MRKLVIVPPRHRLASLGLLFAGGLASIPAARGEACDDRNLVAGRPAQHWSAAYRPELASDGIAALEGDPADSNLATVLGAGGELVWDLGDRVGITALLVQASAEARLAVETSEDGSHFRPLAAVEPVGGSNLGLRVRMLKGLDGHGRFLRLRPLSKPALVGVAELQAYCQTPAAPAVEIRPAVRAPRARDLMRWQAGRKVALGLLAAVALALLALARPGPWNALASLCAASAGALACFFTAGTSGLASFLALLVAVLAIVRLAALRGWISWQRWSVALAVGPLLVAAALAYTDFGRWAGYRSVHYHDAAHYFLGAKYAAELGYTRLYPCVAVAAQQEARWASTSPVLVRDLTDNELVSLPQALAAGRDCATRFGEARWNQFRRDVVFFQSQLHPSAWAAFLQDHGYNATPGWTLLLRTLALGHRPASTGWLTTLTAIDDIALLCLVVLLLWGFGARAGALAVSIIGLGFPWIVLWTGGGIARSLWLVLALAALAVERRGHARLAGALLGLAAGVQIFPALLLSGGLVGWIAGLHRRQPLAAESRRTFVAAGVSLISLVAASSFVAGPSLWLDFLRNSWKHMRGASLNRIGAGQLAMAWSWPKIATALLALALLVLFVRAILRQRREADRTTLSVVMPLVALNLSSYYLALLAGAAPRLTSAVRAPLALGVLVIVPQAMTLLLSDTPTPGYYAAVALLFLAGAAAWLVAEGRPEAPASERQPGAAGLMAPSAAPAPPSSGRR